MQKKEKKSVLKAIAFGFGTSYSEWVCMPEIIGVFSEGDGCVGEVCKAVDYSVHTVHSFMHCLLAASAGNLSEFYRTPL